MKFSSLLILGLFSFALLYLLVGPMLDVLVFGTFMYYIARPVNSRVQRRIKNKPASALLSLCIVVLPIILLLMYTVAVVSVEASNFLASTTLPYVSNLKKVLESYPKVLYELNSLDVMALQQDASVQELLSLGSSVLFGAFGVLFRIFIMMLVSFYLLVDGSGLRHWFESKLVPSESAFIKKLFNEVDYDLNQVFFGNIFTALVIAIIGMILFNILDLIHPPNLQVPYPLLLGMLCGLTSLIPAVGVAFVWIPATIYLIVKSHIHGALLQNSWFIAIFIVSTALLADYGPNWVIRPHLSGKRIHKGLLMLAYILGPISFGVMGLLLGPMILVVVVNTLQAIAEHSGQAEKR